MTSDAYTIPQHVLTDLDLAAWRSFERANALAAEQYEALPISVGRWAPTVACEGCGGRTYDLRGVCWACRNEDRGARA
jgi:hypothetical protein